jgi:DNA-binding Xre family transcriptional regulator
MEPSITAQMILGELKKIIRLQKLHYREIASKIGLSESGFKKLMTSSDCSLARLDTICRVLGVRLLDVIHHLDSPEMIEVEFKRAQERYFETHHEGFLLYWFLVYERRSLEDSMKLLKMESASATKVLIRLDRLGLLTFLPGGEIRLPQPRSVLWVGKSSFIRKMFHQWALALTRKVAKPDPKSGEYFTIRYVPMTETTWSDFLAALQNVDYSFVNRAVREMRLKAAKRDHARWIIAADRSSFAEEEVESFKDSSS